MQIASDRFDAIVDAAIPPSGVRRAITAVGSISYQASDLLVRFRLPILAIVIAVVGTVAGINITADLQRQDLRQRFIGHQVTITSTRSQKVLQVVDADILDGIPCVRVTLNALTVWVPADACRIQ